jgi:hypothetical protein
MLDIGALDTIIAIVIVLLVLSLIVQSIQSLIKKLLKMKSGVVFDSMEDLFTFIDTEKLVGKTPKELVAQVTDEFKALGRVSLILKNPVLDSIAKGDLQKILEKLHGDKLKAHVENWFDTVMQSFDERYARHMKTVALVVSFLVVIFLNANFFNLYRSIAGSDTVRAAIVATGPEILKQAEAANAANKAAESAQPKSTPKPSPNQTPDPSTPEAGTSPTTGSTGSNQPPKETPTPNDAAAAANKSKEQLAQGIKELQGLVGQAEGLGLKPLTWQKVSDFVFGTGPWQQVDAKGQPVFDKDHKPIARPFSDRAARGLEVLLGWTIMALLLSVGAPFWQDTLESLFGVKNLLRKKSDTKNVEDDKGGQQKSD